MSHVFISYASGDYELADRVRDGLERRGIRCWIAPRDIRPGDIYADAIVQAIEGADAFVLLLSDAANESDYVFRELELASASRRRVVPVLVAGVDPSRRFRFFIASSQWLRAPTAGDEGWIDALASTLAPPEPEAPPAEADVKSVEAPGHNYPRRPRFAQHPVRWLGAGAAVLLVLVVVTVAIDRDPDDDGSDGSSGGTTTTGTTADPDDVAALRSHVRFAGCEEVAPEEQGESAELYCPPGRRISAVPGTSSTARSQRWSTGTRACCAPTASSVVRPETRSPRSCRQRATTTSATATTRAAFACFENSRTPRRSSGRSDLLIVSIAQASGSTRATFFDWWAQKAGPFT